MLKMRTLRRPAFLCVAGLVAWSGGGSALALDGFGMGFGYQTPSSVSFLNDHALVRANAAAASRPQPLRAPRRPPRDVEFFSRYDAATRASMEEGIARRPARRPVATAEPTPKSANEAPPARPEIALVSFFDKARQLIWPAGSPGEGDLATKRSHSDAAILAVLKEQEGRGFALIATATDARTRLVDYGQPALQYVRDNSTPRVSDAFHLFLLSLYESIGQATESPRRK